MRTKLGSRRESRTVEDYSACSFKFVQLSARIVISFFLIFNKARLIFINFVSKITLPLKNLKIKITLSSFRSAKRLDYEVAELTWENGQLAMHGLGPPRVANKPTVTSTWEKPSSGGTLESIVNQATFNPLAKFACAENLSELVPWFNHHRATTNPSVSVGGAAMTHDALVPCNNHEQSTHVPESGTGTCVGGCSNGVGSCTPAAKEGATRGGRVSRVGISRCKATNMQCSESATCGGRDSYQVTLDTCELGGTAFTSTSPETSSGKEYSKTSGDDHDSVCHSRSKRKGGDEDGKKKLGINGKSSSSTKRSRAAAIHNQSERKRRDKINQRIKTLQKMVPNSNKIDKASMLDEVIEYLKQLQAQVHMMSRMSMPLPSMMLPFAMQQLQMSMMGMGMGMGMGVMDMNSMTGHATTMPSPATFMSMPPWENPSDRMPTTATSVVPEHLNTFLAYQSQQPMNVDAYNRLAAMYQQFQQNPGTGPKN